MSIKVNETNRDRIETLIKAAQLRSAARCISYENIDQAIKQIEDKFSFATKKSMIGLEVWCDVHAQKLPKAYDKVSHGTHPQSTQFTLAYTASGWALLEVSRQDLRTSDRKKYIVEHMPDTLKRLLKTSIQHLVIGGVDQMITVTLYDFLFLNHFQPGITYLVTWKDKDGKHVDVDFEVYNALTPFLGAKLLNAPINKVEAHCKNCYKIELEDIV